MKKLLMTSIVLGLSLALVAPAAAQGPTLEADPATVSEAGEVEITFTGTGFTDDGFLLPCPGANGDPAAIAEDSCDLANLSPYTAPDFELTVTFDVPAEGLVVVAGNAAQTEVVPAVIAVGEVAQAEAEEELPNTGGNTQALFVMALVLFAAAGAFVVGGRKLQRV